MVENLIDNCITCLTKGSKMNPLTMNVSGFNDNSTFRKLLKEIVKLETPAKYENLMPQNICILCCKNLRSACTFIRQAQLSNKTLISFFDKEFSNTSQKIVALLKNLLRCNMIDKDGVGEIQSKTNASDFEIESTNVILRPVNLKNATGQKKQTAYENPEKGFCDRNYWIELSPENFQTAEHVQNINCFEARTDDDVEHKSVFGIPKFENESSSFIKTEKPWYNENSVDKLEDTEHPQMADDTKISIISEIKIEETQIGSNNENTNKEYYDGFFRCNTCPRKYRRQWCYLNHLKQTHGVFKETHQVVVKKRKRRNDKIAKCRSCDHMSKNRADMYYHRRTNHMNAEDKLKCQFCSYEHVIKYKLFHHINSNHKELIKTLKAEAGRNGETRTANSDSSTSPLSKLILIEQKYSNTEYSSDDHIPLRRNNTKLTSNTQIQTHLNEEQTSDEEFIKNMLNIKRKNFRRTQIKNRECNECGKICGTSHALYSHKQKHKSEEEMRPCPLCKKKFKRTFELTNHIKRFHPN